MPFFSRSLTLLSIGLVGFAIWQSKFNIFRMEQEDAFALITGQVKAREDGFYDQFNNEHCRRIQLPGDAEDPFIDYEEDLMYLAIGDIRQIYFPPVNRYKNPGHHKDRVFVMDLNNGDKLTEYSFDENYKDDFFSHGVDVHKNEKGTRMLFAVNHLIGQSVISAFDIDHKTHQLHFVRHFEHPLIQTPNSLAVVDDRSFFFTNDHGYKTGFLRKVEDSTYGLLKKASIGYCHLDDDDVLQCELKAIGYPYSNGIRFHKKKNLLFVGDSMSGELIVFKVDPKTLNVQELHSVGTGAVVDNLHFDEYDNIYASGAQNATLLLAGIHNPKHVTHVPFMGIRLNADSDYTTIDRVLKSNGTLANGLGFGGAATVVPDTKRRKIYIGSHTAAGLVVCDDIVF